MFTVSYPSSVHEYVLRLCGTIKPGVMPQYVPLKPGAGCIQQECFNNVRTKVEAGGGRIVYGWTIWQHETYFIEAEHHAIYEPPDSSGWIDITPQDIPIDRILFLPDERAVYDFETQIRTMNVRMPLRGDARVSQICDLVARRDELMNSVPGTGMVTVPRATAIKMVTLELQAKQLADELKAEDWQTVGRNEPCPCGSGKKYKKCHGALL